MMSVEQSITPAAYRPITIACRECSRDFIWSAEEQRHYASLGLKHQPRRCRSCRTNKPTRPLPQQKIFRGTVAHFNASKGYGFIRPDDTSYSDVYVHFTQILGQGFVSLTRGQVVYFNIVATDGNKKLAAQNVRIADPTEDSK